VVGAVIAFEIGLVMTTGFDLRDAPVDPQLAQLGNTRMLGIEIYTQYLYPLQIAAVLLLVAIIAAIALTLRRRKDSRYLDPAEQVKVRKADRLRVLKVDPVVRAPTAPAEGGSQEGKA
jgi:NADH-quinone oxidoreductase subunit J